MLMSCCHVTTFVTPASLPPAPLPYAMRHTPLLGIYHHERRIVAMLAAPRHPRLAYRVPSRVEVFFTFELLEERQAAEQCVEL